MDRWQHLDIRFNYQLHQLDFVQPGFKADRRQDLPYDEVCICHFSAEPKPSDFFFQSQKTYDQFENFVTGSLVKDGGQGWVRETLMRASREWYDVFLSAWELVAKEAAPGVHLGTFERLVRPGPDDLEVCLSKISAGHGHRDVNPNEQPGAVRSEFVSAASSSQPLADIDASRPANAVASATSELVALSKLSVSELRARIAAAGGDLTCCVEKKDLVEEASRMSGLAPAGKVRRLDQGLAEARECPKSEDAKRAARKSAPPARSGLVGG